jgi:uncharacterized protein (DUF58 family)
LLTPEELLRRIRQIEIYSDHLADDVFAGQYESAFRGQGVEFAEVRQYYPGDDIRTIDWRVSARAGGLHVKKFVEERELVVMLIVDASASVHYGTAAHTKAETMAEIAATLAFSAIRNQDKVGAVMFTDDAELYQTPKKGRRQVLRLIRNILFFQPQAAGTNIARALDFTARIMTRRAIIFVISDLQDDDYLKPLAALARRHDVVAIEVHDRTERAIPPSGLVELQDAETGRRVLADLRGGRFAHQFAADQQAAAERRAEAINSAGADHIAICAGTSPVRPLIEFFDKRARKRR